MTFFLIELETILKEYNQNYDDGTSSQIRTVLNFTVHLLKTNFIFGNCLNFSKI